MKFTATKTGWLAAKNSLITLPTAQDLAAEIDAYRKARGYRNNDLYKEHWPMAEMTATQVRMSMREMYKSTEYLALLQSLADSREKIFKYFYLGDFSIGKEEGDPMIGMRQYVTAMKAPPKPPEPKVTPIIDRISRVHEILFLNSIAADGVSIVLPENDWLILRSEIEIYYNVKPKDDGSSLRYCGIEFLRGGDDYITWFHGPLSTNLETLREEIIRCLSGGRFGKLPEGTGGDRVSASPDSGGKVGVTSGPTAGNNRNGNGVRHIPDQLDVVSAQAAIAAYARDKKLPGSVSLAQLRELDDRLAGKKGTGFSPSIVKRAAKILSENEVAPDSPPTYIWYDEAASITPEMFNALKTAGFTPRKVDSDRHSLSSEPLSRAINQLNVAEDGRAHRDFIGAAAQGFAEMLDTGDASADRKR